MDTVIGEHGVSYGQTVTSTKIQKLNIIQVQIWQSGLPNHTPSGFTVIAHMRIEVSY